MVDLHSHILPAVDDGAGSFDTACEMLDAAARDGITRLVASSHGMAKAYDDAWRQLLPEAQKRGIELLPGAELDYEQIDSEAGLRTLGNSNFLLIDFKQSFVPPGSESLLFRLGMKGYRIIVAHPERLFHRNPAPCMEALAASSVLFQLNSGSVLGRYGEKIRKAAFFMMDSGWCHLFGNDAHRSSGFRLSECRQMLLKHYSAEVVSAWFDENPERILAGKEPFQIRPPQRNWKDRLRTRLGLY